MSYKNKEKERQTKKVYYQKNKERLLQYDKEYRRNNKEKVNHNKRRYIRNKLKIDIKFRLDGIMGTALYKSLEGKKAGHKWEKLVGYRINDLMTHLERQFKNSKMRWDNYGTYWVVDHIKPKSLFKYETPKDEEFKQCWALKNLQPLTKIRNLKKGNKYNKRTTLTSG